MRYALVSYFDTDTTERIRDIEERIFEMTGSKVARDQWQPHITVGAGVTVEDADLARFEEKIEAFAFSQKSFQVELKDYGFMDNWTKGEADGYTPYVVYIDVLVNNELKDLAESVKGQVTAGQKLYYGELFQTIESYQPHATVAFGDLDKDGFERMKRLFAHEGFSGSATIDHISMVSEDGKGGWSEYKRFTFGG